jgi:5'-nucleotidase
VETQFINWYERDYHTKISSSDLLGLPEDASFTEKKIIRRFVISPGFFRTLPVMPGAVEAVKKLAEKYDVYIVSAAMEFPLSLSEKLEWLNEHFPFISWHNIIFCGDKSIINTDFMIDDHVRNLDPFKGTTIMFNAYHNADHSHHQRVNNWEEILALLNA